MELEQRCSTYNIGRGMCMGYYKRNNEDVMGDFDNGRRHHGKCIRKCARKCEEALEFVEDVKDLLDDLFEEEDDHDCCHKCCKCCCHNDNYWGR
jgi:hypothetical protein